MRATTIIPGIFTQLQKLFNVQMPRFQIGAHSPLALTPLIDRHRSIVHHLKEWHHTLRFTISTLDMTTQRAHIGPVITQTTREFRQQGIFFQRLINAIQIIRHGGQITGGQLRTPGAGIKQRGRRTHKIKAGQQSVEFNCTRLTINFIERQAHRHTHEKNLRQFETLIFDMQKITVVQGLQAKIAKLQITGRIELCRQTHQVKLRQLVIQQLRLNSALNEFREILRITRRHIRLRHLFTQNFTTNIIQQQTCCNKTIRGILLNQCARRQNSALAHLLYRHPVIQILQRVFEYFLRIHRLTQARTSRFNPRRQTPDIQRTQNAALLYLQDLGRLAFILCLATLTRALLPIQHIRTRHIMLTRTHQGKLDLILNILNMKRAAVRLATHQRINHTRRHLLNHFTHARGSSTLPAVHRKKCLRHGNRNFARLKRNDCAITANYLILIQRQAAAW